MKNKLVVVADLGHLKAYRVEYDDVSSHPKLDLIANLATDEADGRVSDKLTDEAGRFKGGQRSQKIHPSGERHNIGLEFERRAVGRLAANINRIVKLENHDAPVYFAAHKEIHNELLHQLEPGIRARIEKIVPEDLVKVKGLELLAHF